MRRVTALVGVLLLVGGVALGILGGRELADTLARRDGTRVTGFVTDKQVSQKRVRAVLVDSYDVRYRFELGGTAYTAGDATGRTNLFVAVPREQWEQLEVGDPVEVTYATDNPGNNRPARSAGSLGDPIAGLVLGVLLGLVGLLVLLVVRRPAPVAPEAVPTTPHAPVTSAVTVVPPDVDPGEPQAADAS